MKGFEIVGIQPGVIMHRNRRFDLANLSQQQAEFLHETNCRYIKKLPPATTKKEKE